MTRQRFEEPRKRSGIEVARCSTAERRTSDLLWLDGLGTGGRVLGDGDERCVYQLAR